MCNDGSRPRRPGFMVLGLALLLVVPARATPQTPTAILGAALARTLSVIDPDADAEREP